MGIVGIPSLYSCIEGEKLNVLKTEHQGDTTAFDVLVVDKERCMPHQMLAGRPYCNHMLRRCPFGYLDRRQVMELFGGGKTDKFIMNFKARKPSGPPGDNQGAIPKAGDCPSEGGASTMHGKLSGNRVFGHHGERCGTGHAQVGGTTGCKNHRIATFIVSRAKLFMDGEPPPKLEGEQPPPQVCFRIIL